MKNVISLEISKHIQSVIKDMETEYKWYVPHCWPRLVKWNEDCWQHWENNQIYKTLTIDEAIDVCQRVYAWFYRIDWVYDSKRWNIFEIELWDKETREIIIGSNITWKTLLQAVEKMLLYLYDNNLLK